MADISRYPFRSHLRSEAASHVVLYGGGRRLRSGRGLAFWFAPWRTSIVEIPLDDRDTDFVFTVRSQDFQTVTVQGTVTWRAGDPDLLAERMDFTINLANGRLRADPMDRISSLLIGMAQHQAARYIEQRPVQALLQEGSGPRRQGMEAALSGAERLAGMGLHVETVRLAGVSPTSELARALETPTFEKLQERADEATFSRRAQAVEKERAIAENELATRIELSRRQAALIRQEDENERRRAEAQAEAGRVRVMEGARVDAELARLATVKDLDPRLLYALAARAFAEKLTRIDTLNVTPDLAAALAGMLRGPAPAAPAPAAPSAR